LRLDQNAVPTKLFEGPGLRAVLGIVGANIDKVAAARSAEKLELELVFELVGENRLHRQQLAFAEVICGDCREWPEPRNLPVPLNTSFNVLSGVGNA
jgi:hypothetical protein